MIISIKTGLQTEQWKYKNIIGWKGFFNIQAALQCSNNQSHLDSWWKMQHH
jgi:hypothetical protein